MQTMLGVIIHFLIQLAVVVLTVGEDFAEQKLFVFNFRMQHHVARQFRPFPW